MPGCAARPVPPRRQRTRMDARWSTEGVTRFDDGQEAGGARGSGERATGSAAGPARGRRGTSVRTIVTAGRSSGAAAGSGGKPRRSRSGRGEAGRADAARQAAAPDALSPREAGMRTGTAPATSAASSSARKNRGRVHVRESLTARNLRAPRAGVQAADGAEARRRSGARTPRPRCAGGGERVACSKAARLREGCAPAGPRTRRACTSAAGTRRRR
jgi:hypothetical protein